MLQIKSFQFSPIQENTYILYNAHKECIIIDPGCYFDEEKETLVQYIDDMSLKPMMLLNTHCHLDHVFGNKFVSEKFKLDLHIHTNEQSLLEYAPASGLMYNLPFDNYKGRLVFLDEKDTVHLGEDRLDIILAPGHSPGSLCFYSRESGFLIGGNVLFKNSIGRTDLPGGDFDTLIQSIKNKLFILPDDTIVYSGHGPATTIGEEKLYNPFLK